MADRILSAIGFGFSKILFSIHLKTKILIMKRMFERNGLPRPELMMSTPNKAC